MTSLTSAEDHHHGSDDEDDHDEEHERSGRRPGFDRRGSSGSTIVAAEQPRGRARSSDGQGSRSRSRAKSSPQRQTPEGVEVTIQDVTPMATPPREEMRRPSEDNPQHLKKGGAIDKVVGSYQSTTGTGSDWESATDSPAPAKKKELPEAPRAYRQDTISGLGQVLGEGDRIASEEDARLGNETSTSDLVALQANGNGNGVKDEEKSRPPTPRRAKFEIDDSDDTSPPSPEALRQLQQLDQQPVDAPVPAIAPAPLAAETPFASEPQSPIKEHELKPVTPPQDKSKSAPSVPDVAARTQQSTVPFPSTTALNDTSRSQSTTATAGPTSPSHLSHHPRPSNTARKSSNASLMSNASVRSNALSFAGRMGPPAPHLFRRSASSVAPPTVDRASCAKAEMAHLEPEGAERDSREGGSGPRKSSGGHRRTESLGSVRSLRTVAEGGHVGGPTSPSGHPKRAATLGVHDARDATRRLRQSTGSESGGALAALGNIQGGAERGGPPRRSASGYFSSALRGLTTQFPGLTPPLSPSASVGAGIPTPGGAGGKYPIPGATTPQHGAGANRGKQRASPSPAQFAPLVISKFIEPQDLLASQQQEPQQQQQQQQQLSVSPASTRFGANARNASSASLSGGGAMSRTQQKALLARDAPYWSGNAIPNSAAPNGAQPTPSGSGYYNPNQPSTALHAPLPLPPPPATQLLPLTTNATQGQQYHQQQPSQSAKMARTASGGTNSYPASTSSPAPGDHARQQGMQKWAYGLVREAERIERQYRAVEKWRDPLGESLERVMKARKERSSAGSGGAGKVGANGMATPPRGAAVVAAKGEIAELARRRR